MTSRLNIILLALLAIGMALFLLCHFICIWIYGEFYIYESNVLVLTLETAMIIGILGFSAYCVVKELQKFQRSSSLDREPH